MSRSRPVAPESRRSADANHPDLAAALGGRIAIVALLLLTQLWALTAALEAWYERDMAAVWWLLGYQVVAFSVSLAIWIARPKERRVADR